MYNWKVSKRILPYAYEWKYLFYRLFEVYPYRIWCDLRRDIYSIFKHGISKAPCGLCWFTCKGHDYRSPEGLCSHYTINHEYSATFNVDEPKIDTNAT